MPVSANVGLPKPLVTSFNNACGALACGRDHLYGLIHRGEVDSFLDGRVRKVTVASLERYIAKRVEASAKQFERSRYPTRAAVAQGDVVKRRSTKTLPAHVAGD